MRLPLALAYGCTAALTLDLSATTVPAAAGPGRRAPCPLARPLRPGRRAPVRLGAVPHHALASDPTARRHARPTVAVAAFGPKSRRDALLGRYGCADTRRPADDRPGYRRRDFAAPATLAGTGRMAGATSGTE